MNQIVDTVYINCNFEVQLSFASHDIRIHFMDYGCDVQFCNVASVCGFVGRNQEEWMHCSPFNLYNQNYFKIFIKTLI